MDPKSISRAIGARNGAGAQVKMAGRDRADALIRAVRGRSRGPSKALGSDELKSKLDAVRKQVRHR